MPRRHQASFGQLSSEDLDGLAHVVRVTLRALNEALEHPDFNLMIHSAPFEDEHKPYYMWHVQIVPRLTTLAGFELGSGMRITSVAPEESARIRARCHHGVTRGPVQCFAFLRFALIAVALHWGWETAHAVAYVETDLPFPERLWHCLPMAVVDAA